MENCGMSLGMLEGEDQMFSGRSMSHGALVQQAAAALNKECEAIKASIEEKDKEKEKLKQLCAKQAENITKQKSKLEHLKLKTHREEMKNKSHLSKIYALREKLQVLDKYFDKWGNTINPMLQHRNELEEILKQLKDKQEMKEISYKQREEANKRYLDQAEKAYMELREYKEKEKIEFDGYKLFLNNELKKKKLTEKLLEEKLKHLQSECREKQIAIDILEPQRAELKNTLDKFKTELDAEKEKMNVTRKQLEASLYEVRSKKNQMSSYIETTDKKINEMNSALREKEIETTMLEIKLKGLIAEEQEHEKISKIEQQELQELESTMEELTVRLNTLMKIDLENVTLKENCSELENNNESYKKKIAEAEINEEASYKKIEELNKFITELEVEREKVINDIVIIEEKIENRRREEDVNETEHNKLSVEIDKTLAELQDDNARLKTSMHNFNQQLLLANETKKNHDLALKNLEGELAQSKADAQNSDFKLFSYNEECNAVRNNYLEEVKILEETLQLCKEDYEEAMADCKRNEETKKEFLRLAKDFENKQESFSKVIQQLQESNAAKIESKSKAVAEQRAQWEREYKNKELIKTDHLVELKKTKARIIDLQRQKILFEKDIKTKVDVLRKSDNLIQRMETKFNKVAQVAEKSSQSVADPASQQTDTTQSGNQRKRVRANSPDRDSSGKTFDKKPATATAPAPAPPKK